MKFSALAAVTAAGLAFPGLSAAAPASAAPPGHGQQTITSTGLLPGQIKHVWLIILENKSYDATFTGLNQNSYLWKTLPSQGVLLKDYYGTGHYSQDNYTSMVSGQSPSLDLQSDCDVANTNLGSNANIITTHAGKTFGAGDNYGQVLSPAGANAKDGTNGCTFPKDVATLFNQFDAAGVPFFSVLTDPTFGGTEASLALLADINIAEPGAAIGFTGPRVIKQATYADLPPGFQSAEFQLARGQVDMVVPRVELRPLLAHLVDMYT